MERTLRPPHSRAVGFVGVGVGVLYTLGLLLWVLLREDGWALSPLLLLGLFLGVHGRALLATRVEIAPHGLTIVDPRRPRGPVVAWESINGVRIDPPGGARRVHLKLREAEVSLPALRDADNDVVLEALRTRRA